MSATDSSGVKIRRLTRTINPATGEMVGEVLENTVEELNVAVESAVVAQKSWAALAFHQRLPYLLRMRDHIAAHADEIAATIAAETGKTLMDALSTEVMPATMAVNYYAKRASRILGRKRIPNGNILLANKRSYIDHVPYGVVGIISPWNYPFGIPVHEIAMALIAGNAVVIKVASQTLQVGERLKESVEAAGFPEDVFHLINLPGSVASCFSRVPPPLEGN
jgi:acyl-CoA reductase-like NAD-dependent aldehyde dehydrogenase